MRLEMYCVSALSLFAFALPIAIWQDLKSFSRLFLTNDNFVNRPSLHTLKIRRLLVLLKMCARVDKENPRDSFFLCDKMEFLAAFSFLTKR